MLPISVLKFLLSGHKEDYDRWETEFGLKDWGWDIVKKYFVKLENVFFPARPGEFLARIERETDSSTFQAQKSSEVTS